MSKKNRDERWEKGDNVVFGNEIPMGFGMALAANIDAMNYFSALSNEKKKDIVTKTHGISSKQEMQSFVDSLIPEAN